MRLMVLGARGFVGAAVARRAVAKGWTVGAAARASTSPWRLAGAAPGLEHLEADLADAGALRLLIEGWRPDAVVQSAFVAGHGGDSPTAGADYFRRGLAPSLALAEALAAARFRGVLVHAGSAMAFGAAGRAHRAGDALAPGTPRGLVKACCTLAHEQAARAVGFRLCELFIYTVYGPREQRGRLVPTLLRSALGGPETTLAATAAPRNWIHVDDVADACLAAAERAPDGCSRALVGAADGVRDTHEIARLLEKISGRSLIASARREMTDRYGDADLALDPEPARALLGWSPRHSPETGLRDSWDWAQSPEGRAWLTTG